MKPVWIYSSTAKNPLCWLLLLYWEKEGERKEKMLLFFFFTAVITHPNEDKKGYLY